MFVTHASHCYSRIKRHYGAIIHGPLVAFLQQVNESRQKQAKTGKFAMTTPPVGAVECNEAAIFFLPIEYRAKDQDRDQKIAGCASSYRASACLCRSWRVQRDCDLFRALG
jgi:hypothetical protein